jgi:hypothetical protein
MLFGRRGLKGTVRREEIGSKMHYLDDKGSKAHSEESSAKNTM